ncbi:hypothetical protein B9Z55_013901 [Caenorhabditis nigoni]|uniref:G-protein coupled receptors family 1 profile domain-containing protein n=1 Tax=Caenorhabditis nigoni TaxID=1611254 RepID=A0A2G5U3Q3_9PELO|nr:hypothetical protein B9Z55_013901 [Caenorhabditis nigoni]
MYTYSEVTVDVNTPNILLTFYRIHGMFALVFNILGVVLIMKNPRIVRLYRGFMLNMQILSLLADAQTTLLMQPVYIFPIIGGYTNGVWWNVFRMSSHLQMGIFLLFLYLQVASIVCAIVTKYHVVSNIGNASNRPLLFWIFVIFYHSCAFLIFGIFCISYLTKEQAFNLVKIKFPNAMNIFRVENVEVYDMEVNKWMIMTTSMIIAMLTSSLLISLYFSIRLLRTLRSKRLVISARSFRGHQIAVTSLMAQATIPFIVIIIPIGTIVYFFVQIVPNSQGISNIMMAIYSFHSSLSTAVMIISTPQYRKMIRRGFKSPTALTSPQMTRVHPLSATTFRLKKLSTPEM